MSKRLVRHRKRLLAGEDGTVTKEWGGRISICLIFPNRYHVGMSNLGFHLLYGLLNERSDVVCERSFMPDRQEAAEYTRTGTPLCSLETGTPIHKFHIIAFSVPFENDYLNILTLLRYGGIPLKSADRPPGSPLVMAGGAAVSLNPEPLASFIDLAVIGEAEEVVNDLLVVTKTTGLSDKYQFLEQAMRIEGIYVPAMYHADYDERGILREFSPRHPRASFPIRRRVVRDLDQHPAHSTITTPHTEFKETFLIEMNRGCPHNCHFCAARCLYLPFRNRSLPAMTTDVDLGIAKGKRIGLVGSALTDHPQFYELCEYILNRGGSISFASLRTDTITDRLAELVRRSGQQTVTLAPETGSERLRGIINKGFTEREILAAARTMASHGITNMKLYFMVGLPTETSEDIHSIVAITRRIQHEVVRETRRPLDLTITLSPFVPKAWTTFQWHPFEDLRTLRTKITTIQHGFKKVPRVRVVYDLPKWGYVQTMLSMGDRRTSEILLRTLETGGEWSHALRNHYLNPDFWVYRSRTHHETLPWDFIAMGPDKETLWRRYTETVGVPAS